MTTNGRISKAEWGSDVIVETLRGLGIEYVAMNPRRKLPGRP